LNTISFDHQVDASGLLCPLPLLKSKRQLNRMQPGEVLLLIATDPNAEDDLRKFCDQSSHQLLRVDQVDDRQRIYLQKS
jgi:tRNA 2-thiouridine synthesizing protein A